MKKFIELLRLVAAFPRSHRIFLRPEYDRLFPLFRHIARFYRRVVLRRTRIVTVIGSLGKTTTHHAVMAALDCPDRNFSFSNYGMNVAENLLKVRPWDRWAALEVGIAGPNEMDPYAPMIRPDLVVVTSIASEHFRTLPTLNHTRAEKVKMLSALPSTATAVLNGDDPNVLWMATQTAARIVTYGRGADNEVRATDILTHDASTTFNLHLGGEVHAIRSRLSGEHMIYPILAAATVAHLESIDLAAALDRLAELAPPALRMEQYSLPSGVTILDDSFKSSIESVYAAIDAMARIPARRKIVVIGETGTATQNIGDAYREIGSRLAAVADIVICIGSKRQSGIRSGATQAGMDPDAIILTGPRSDSASEFLRKTLKTGDLVLFKGSIRQKLQRLPLSLQGEPVSCRVKFCQVKVSTCSECPLLNAPASKFENHFIRRFLDP